MSLSRTVTVILVLTNIFITTNCDSDRNFDQADLLRGSGEVRAADDIIMKKKEETRQVDHFNTATEEYTTTLIPEITTSKTNESEATSSEEMIEEIDTRNDSVTITPMDMTETTDAQSDTNGYKSMEDSNTSINENSIGSGSMGDTSAATTAKAIEEIEGVRPGVVSLSNDEPETSQRNPKTENSEPKPERRNYKPQPVPPAATKSNTLKQWMEDVYLRQPAALLVPLRPMALNRALAVWNDLTVDGLNVTDIVIVGFDSSGVNWRSRHNLQHSKTKTGYKTVSEALSKLILKYQGVNTDSTSDATMKALISATKLVPYDSAIFVLTDKRPADGRRLSLALRALVEKRLKVYTIWTDPAYPSDQSEQELQDLKNISQHTDGDVLPYSLQVMDMENNGNLADQLDMETTKAIQGRGHGIADDEKFDTLLVRRGGGEAISLGVPVENGVSALRILIEGLVEHAVLYPPNEAPLIDLYNKSSVRAFSPASRTLKMSPRDVTLVFPGADRDMKMLTVVPMTPKSQEASAPTVGLWRLSVRCDTCDYRLYVTATSKIHLYTAIENQDTLKIRVLGPVASVRESVLIDEYGTELSKLNFSYQPSAGEPFEPLLTRIPAELIADVPMPAVKGSKVYAKVVGRDVRGEPFVRLSGPLGQPEVRLSRSASIAFPDAVNDLEQAEVDNSKVYNQRIRYNESNVLPYNRAISQVVNQRGSLLTAVQVGLSTRLYGSPGDALQLHFEVTNYREQAVRFSFEAVGELRFLRGINPTSQTILSGQTANVIVSLTITATAQPGARDLITFTAYGLEQVSISAYVYVTNSGENIPDTWAPELRHNFQGSCIGRLGSDCAQHVWSATGLEQVSISAYVYVTNSGENIPDTWAPELRHNFQGSCIGRLGSDCAQHVWSATVIARDSVSGLLRLSSSPFGLVYDSNFISGSREEVIATYRATCCAPRLSVTAVDAFGNANSYVLDITNYISEGGIAAIVLGVFLLIALIALLVFLISWCVRRRRKSRELPYSASTTRNLS